MRLSLQERVALIYTSQGSQTKTAALIGISRQRVGRILLTGRPELGGLKSDSRALKNPALIAAVDGGYQAHIKLSHKVAQRDGLPFDKQIPVFVHKPMMPQTQRVVYTDGSVSYEKVYDDKGRPLLKKGERVVAPNTHWLSDRLRNAWLAACHKSGKYLRASIGSTVNLKIYNKQADARFKESKQRHRGESARLGKAQIKGMIDRGIQLARIYTRYTDMRPMQFSIDGVLQDINDKLFTKHEPATGDFGTRLADEIILQINKRPR